jgi:hypothetical protein
MVENSSEDRQWVMQAVRKYCWRALAGLLLSGLLLAGPCFAQEWGSVGGGYIYQVTEGTTAHWTSSNGWYVLPTFNINKKVGVSADFANFYSKGQNIHVDLFGPFHAFSNKTRFTPFVFTGIGRIRDSKAGTITNSFAWYAGGGLMIRLTRWVSFQTIPIEYVMNTANYNVGNNFVARAGFALTIPKSSRNH